MRLKRLSAKQFIVIMLMIVLCFCITFFAREYFANILVGYIMDEIEIPGEKDRVLVFAPHSDDEALSAADLIKKSIQNGAQVEVVLATNGDGFARAVAMESINIHPKPEDYIRYGHTRQTESLLALRLLGVKDENVIFLGYPDRGISRLWSSNWMSSKPYFSSYTKTYSSPYYNNYSSEALYSGENLYKDIAKIIEEFQPTHIVYPHSNDKHTDHWSLNAFVKYSMKCTNYKPEHEWLYLVHRGGWPTPLKRNRSMFLAPPMSLYSTGTKWLSLSMSDEDIEYKSQVFKQYKSQIKRIGLLMSAFERKNELFGEYENAILVKGINHDSDIEAKEDNRVIEDPSRDSLNVETSKPSDIVELHAEVSKENKLHIFISLNNKPDKLTTYHLNMIFFKDGKASPLNLIINGSFLKAQNYREASIVDIKDMQVNVEKRLIHVTIPQNKIGDYDSIFMNAESSIRSYYMDRTSWRMVDTEQPPNATENEK